MKKIKSLFWGVGLFCLLAGILFGIRDGLLIDWWSGGFILAASLVTAAVAFGARMKGFLTLRRCITAFLIGIGYLGILEYAVILAEAEKIYIKVIQLINMYYRTSFAVPSPPGAAEDYRYFIALLCVVFGVWLAMGLNSKKWLRIALLPVLLSLLPGLLLGYPPSVVSIEFLLVGGGFLYASAGEREKETEASARSAAFGCMILAFFLSLILLEPVSGWALSHYGEWKAFQLSVEDKALDFFESRGWFSDMYLLWGDSAGEVNLTNKPPKLGKDEVFRITVEEPPKDNLYVKNFTGGAYSNGTWQPISQEDFAAFAMEQGMEPEQCAEAVARLPYENIKAMAVDYEMVKREMASPQQKVFMEHLSKRVSPGLPYFSSMPKGAVYQADGTPILKDMKSYTIDSTLDQPNMSTTFKDENGIVVQSITNTGEKNKELKEAYRSYVLKEYTGVPDYLLHELEQAMLAGHDFQLYDDYTYSFNLTPVPKGEDPVLYFLFEQKKGYCMHFASALTLIYRSVGTPARYASGYLVFPSDFVQNEEGTWTAVVTGERGHAWTEAYNTESGWYPVEATPPAYTNGVEQAAPDTELSETVNRVEEQMQAEREREREASQEAEKAESPEEGQEENTPAGEGQDENQEGSLSPQEDGEISGPPSEKETERLPKVNPVWYAAAAVMLLAFILFIRKRVLLHIRKKQFSSTDTREAIVSITQETLRLLKSLGFVDVTELDEPAFGELVQQELPWLGKGSFIRFLETAREAAYGREELTREQLAQQLAIYEKLKAHAKEMAGFWKRLWESHIRILY